MWRNVSLRARINVLLAVVLTLGLAINIGRLVLEAGPRVAAEDQSVLRLARAFVETIVTGLAEAPAPEARLHAIISDLSGLRHVSIRLQSEDDARADGADDDEPRAPTWFVTLVHPEKTSVGIPVMVGGRQDALVITSHPDDEIAEIWDGIVTQLVVGSAIAATLFLITMIVVGRALAPLQKLSQAMSQIEDGGYETRVTPGGSPELAAICRKLNHLAATLDQAVDDKRRLAERTVSLQDIERKEIARELHDEFGPYLFALRAHAGALMRQSDVGAPDRSAIRRHGTAILDQVNAVQHFNRRILEKLRPVGLAEFGLREALGALVRLWQETHPDVAINMTLASSLGATGETSDLTIYRVVQEALTNVFRHADASTVDVTIAPADQSSRPRSQRGSTLVRIRDNGRGLAPDHKLGFGLVGMRERLLALGGTFAVASADAGVTVEAMVPGDHTQPASLAEAG